MVTEFPSISSFSIQQISEIAFVVKIRFNQVISSEPTEKKLDSSYEELAAFGEKSLGEYA